MSFSKLFGGLKPQQHFRSQQWLSPSHQSLLHQLFRQLLHPAQSLKRLHSLLPKCRQRNLRRPDASTQTMEQRTGMETHVGAIAPIRSGVVVMTTMISHPSQCVVHALQCFLLRHLPFHSLLHLTRQHQVASVRVNGH